MISKTANPKRTYPIINRKSNWMLENVVYQSPYKQSIEDKYKVTNMTTKLLMTLDYLESIMIVSTISFDWD